MTEDKSLNLDELAMYVVMGTTADGKYVTAQSPNVTMQDMAGMLARLQVNLHIQAAEVGCSNAMAPKQAKVISLDRN